MAVCDAATDADDVNEGEAVVLLEEEDELELLALDVDVKLAVVVVDALSVLEDVMLLVAVADEVRVEDDVAVAVGVGKIPTIAPIGDSKRNVAGSVTLLQVAVRNVAGGSDSIVHGRLPRDTFSCSKGATLVNTQLMFGAPGEHVTSGLHMPAGVTYRIAWPP